MSIVQVGKKTTEKKLKLTQLLLPFRLWNMRYQPSSHAKPLPCQRDKRQRLARSNKEQSRPLTFAGHHSAAWSFCIAAIIRHRPTPDRQSRAPVKSHGRDIDELSPDPRRGGMPNACLEQVGLALTNSSATIPRIFVPRPRLAS